MKKLFVVALAIIAVMVSGCDAAVPFAERYPDFTYDAENNSYVKETKRANLSEGCAVYDIEYTQEVAENNHWSRKITLVKCPKQTTSTSYMQGKGNHHTIILDPMD